MKGIKFALLALAATGCATRQPVCSKDYPALKAAEIADIKAGETVLKKVIIDGFSEADLTPGEIAAAELMEQVQESRRRYVDAADLEILDGAAAILSRPDAWDRADDRECGAQDVKFSLFCALKRASELSTGEYEHRRTALQEVRFAIEDLRPGVEYEHRLRDFNNESRTTFDEIRLVLSTARSRVADRLTLQGICAV